MRIFGTRTRSNAEIAERNMTALEAIADELVAMKQVQTGGTSSMYALGYAQGQRDAAIRLARLIAEKMTDG